ncbi:MAG: Unknown protein [uncultured Sulfurovum sp.]|uniref:Uncharacterized protein n=1 Tax=uncultured Sulfurovum sp. TaxID=269237 RepID=A0A6S6TSE9_9BACT|nr:MAG: Unknown protein [uncultured Sulfurovum sp.]
MIALYIAKGNAHNSSVIVRWVIKEEENRNDESLSNICTWSWSK